MNFSYGWYIIWNCSLELFLIFMSCTSRCLLNSKKALSFHFENTETNCFDTFEVHLLGRAGSDSGFGGAELAVNIPLAKPDSLSFQNNLVVHLGQYRKHKYWYKWQDCVWPFLVLKFCSFPLGKERKKRSVGLFWMFCLEGESQCAQLKGSETGLGWKKPFKSTWFQPLCHE